MKVANDIIYCVDQDYEAVVKEEAEGAVIIGIPADDFYSLTVADVFGDTQAADAITAKFRLMASWEKTVGRKVEIK